MASGSISGWLAVDLAERLHRLDPIQPWVLFLPRRKHLSKISQGAISAILPRSTKARYA